MNKCLTKVKLYIYIYIYYIHTVLPFLLTFLAYLCLHLSDSSKKVGTAFFFSTLHSALISINIILLLLREIFVKPFLIIKN